VPGLLRDEVLQPAQLQAQADSDAAAQRKRVLEKQVPILNTFLDEIFEKNENFMHKILIVCPKSGSLHWFSKMRKAMMFLLSKLATATSYLEQASEVKCTQTGIFCLQLPTHTIWQP
jgi:hypothetical protein